MRVVVSAGGTGGHIYPALAIINKIKAMEPTSEFLYIGTHNRMEKDIIPKAGIPFEAIEMYGVNRKRPWKNMKTVISFIKGYQKCKKLIKQFKPDVVIGVGGYITVPVIYAAAKLDIKTFLHEQNSIPGKANQFLSKYATKIGISFRSSMKYFPEYKTVYTGNPCSEQALGIKPIYKSSFGFKQDRKLVVSVMGSLGASKVNEYIATHLFNLDSKDYQWLMITGKEEYETFAKPSYPSNVKLVPYIDNLPALLQDTDLLVSRAGASTISEIIALQIPTILIPSPYVPNNHQYKNAIDLVNDKAALLIEEKELIDRYLFQQVDQLLMDNNQQKNMKAQLKKLQVPKSATLIYEILKSMIGG